MDLELKKVTGAFEQTEPTVWMTKRVGTGIERGDRVSLKERGCKGGAWLPGVLRPPALLRRDRGPRGGSRWRELLRAGG